MSANGSNRVFIIASVMASMAMIAMEATIVSTAMPQDPEFGAESQGYTATKHQREVGTGYFDAVSVAITGGLSTTTAMHGSTERAQVRLAAE